MMINLIDRIKLLFRKDKELYVSLYDVMGFYPRNIRYYKVALAHKSSRYRNEKGKPFNNERLEYLGDAVLETVVSDILYHHFDRKHEGFLSSTRSKVVQRDTLNNLSKKMGLDQLVKRSAISESHNCNMGGNAFEALVGAIYLDRGFLFCKQFVKHQVLGKYINLDSLAKKETNFKSKLLEWCQKNKVNLTFSMDNLEKDDNNSPKFKSVVMIEGLQAGEGIGYSKKESQQNAAKESLTKLRRQPQFINKVLKEKEKRTAMEASEFTVPPSLEVAEDIAEDRNNLKLRTRPKHSRRRPAKTDSKPQAEKAVAKAPKENKGVAEVSGVENGVFADDLIVRVNTPEVAKIKEEEYLKTLPASPKSKGGKVSGNRGENGRSNATAARNKRMSAEEEEREAIIRAAEEAAFKENEG